MQFFVEKKYNWSYDIMEKYIIN